MRPPARPTSAPLEECTAPLVDDTFVGLGVDVDNAALAVPAPFVPGLQHYAM